MNVLLFALPILGQFIHEIADDNRRASLIFPAQVARDNFDLFKALRQFRKNRFSRKQGGKEELRKMKFNFYRRKMMN